MKKKQRRKKVSIRSSPVAAYKKGVDLYLKKNDPNAALKYLFKAAKAEYTKAYGEIGIILHRENNEPAQAEEWFIKAEKSDSLFPAAAYEYGMLHYLSKDDWETGLNYLLNSANQGYELAYGDTGTIIYLYEEKTDEAEEWFRKAEAENCLFAPAAYYFGLLLWMDRANSTDSFKYFKKAAEEGFEPAYGQYGTVLYLENLDYDEAEKWFEKAEAADCLYAPQAHDYGMLLIEERGEIERGKKYIKMAEDDGYY